MDKNSLIGLILIFAILFVWHTLTKPTEEQLKEQQRIRDSIELAEARPEGESIAQAQKAIQATTEPDSIKEQRLQAQYGNFAASMNGTPQRDCIENDVFKVCFSNKGGRIEDVELKTFKKNLDDGKSPHDQVPVKLFEDEKNKFEYILPLNVQGGMVSSEQIYFSPTKNGQSITYSAALPNGGSMEQVYTINNGSFGIEYDVNFNGIDRAFNPGTENIKLNWVNYLDKIEINDNFEKYYTSVYYKAIEETPEYCSCRSDDEEETQERLKWVSHANQFFNMSLIADDSFKGASLTTSLEAVKEEDLKLLTSKINIPIDGGSSQTVGMKIFAGPNDFNTLKAFSPDLENIIPYGWSIFGTINRWIIRPSFEFLNRFIGMKGIVIIILTFLIKMLVFPLTYKMLYSQQKMAALKPRLTKLKDKYKDDQQQYSMEQMKLYREYGVSPLGGCMPMILQMPIWYALFRFFPASIDFRQASFLWADDLSSYDDLIKLPFEMPEIIGNHLSLFTLLWAVTTIIYTYYNTKHMEMGANPAMKYMQYAMPLMFLVFFNNYASGLTCYMFFSNLFNIGQTLITKNFIIDKKKIEEELANYKKKPKKKGKFQERLEQVMAEQQKITEERQKQGKKKNKK